MKLKFLGGGVLVLGLVIMLFAGIAYFELHAAAKSPTAPPADSLPLTRIVNPELFDPATAGKDPESLARSAFNRICMIGGGGLVMAILAVLILAAPHRRGPRRDEAS